MADLKMPTYKLYSGSFQGRGRAELIRWIFIQTGVPYEDVRFTKEEWEAFKPKSPYGGLPILEIDGKLFGGSGPIERYVAEQHRLAGSNELENFELNTIYDLTFDLLLWILLHRFEKEDARKAELKKELNKKHFPKYLGILNKLITNNGVADGWIFGNKVTYIDMRVAQLADSVLQVNPNALDGYPAVAKLKATVEALPKIAKWIKERPESEL